MEKLKIWKHLRVAQTTHRRVKALGVFKSMSIDEVINYLVDKENENKPKVNQDYRRRG